MDRSRHTNKNYMKGSQVDKYINSTAFKNLNELPGQIYKVAMFRTHIEQMEPIIVGILIFEYAKLTILQHKYYFIPTSEQI